MRQVQVFKWEQQVIDGCRKSVKVADFIGYFHQFGQDADGEGQSNPVAIVERKDGEVVVVYCGLVQFLPNRYPPSVPPKWYAGAQERVLPELVKADRIIRVMLDSMSSDQKSECAALLLGEGVSSDGMTRENERDAIIKALGAA